MKRHGRALHFAVTGALLGGIGVGCAKPRGPYTNTGRMGGPEPEEQIHVNPGPDEDPGAADGGAAEGGEPEPTEHVNEGPVEEPPKLDEGTNNVRKVEDEGPATPERKHVNPARVAEPPK